MVCARNDGFLQEIEHNKGAAQVMGAAPWRIALFQDGINPRRDPPGRIEAA